MPFRYRQRFVFVAQLGRGGQGAVFQARDLLGDGASGRAARDVAVKVVRTLAPTDVADPEVARKYAEHNAEMLRRFDLESGAAGHLAGSPYFVEVLAYEKGYQPYLVMEYVKFPTLEGFMAKRREDGLELSGVEVAAFGKELLAGVGVMHGHNIIHRDLKPGNLFVDYKHGRWQVKITDLGIWTRPGDQPEGVEVSIGPTIPLHVAPPPQQPRGTPSWMSPEQQDRQALNAPSDLHAVASILWWMWAGEIPYAVDKQLWVAVHAARTEDERAAAWTRFWSERRERLKLLPERPPRMSEGLHGILCRTFAFDPARRFQKASEFRDALDGFIRAEEQASRAALEDAKKRVAALRDGVAVLAVGLRTFEDFALARQNIEKDVNDLALQLETPSALDLRALRDGVAQREREIEALAAQIRDHLDASRPPPPPQKVPPTVVMASPSRVWFGALVIATVFVGVAGWHGGRRSVPSVIAAGVGTPRCDAGTVAVSASTQTHDAEVVLVNPHEPVPVRIERMNPWVPVPGTQVDLQRHEVSLREYGIWEPGVGVDASLDDTPVTNITPNRAAEFCRGIGARLASEVAWHNALAGWTVDASTFSRSSWPHSVRFEFAPDTAPSGHRDLIGNVSEWIASPNPQEFLRLGGNYGMSGADALNAARTPQRYVDAAENLHFLTTGFRCERDHPSATRTP